MTHRVRIIAGGVGGQGILTLGKMMSYAAIHARLQVSCLATYGAEMRGGYVYCMIVISPSMTSFSPVSAEGDLGVFLDRKAYNQLSDYLKEGATAIINSSLIGKISKKGLKTLRVPASEKSEELGDIRAANMIAAGALGYMINKNFYRFGKSSLYYGLSNVVKNPSIIDLSRRAIDDGWTMAESEYDGKERAGKTE